MNTSTTIGDWTFTTTQVKARKTLGVEDPTTYTAMADISIVNDQAHVEGLIAKGRLTRQDYETITDYLASQGFTEYYAKRNGVLNKVPIL
jgi:hypothetical protein